MQTNIDVTNFISYLEESDLYTLEFVKEEIDRLIKEKCKENGY